MRRFGRHAGRRRRREPCRARHARWRRDTATASICRVVSGSVLPWRGRCAQYDAAQGWCCSTSRQHSSMSAARQRCSTRCCRQPVDATTILISHRFSTVRHADRICVLERGRVVELGSHDELMALGGRYKTMFELQPRGSRPRWMRKASCSMSSDATLTRPRADRHGPVTTSLRQRSHRCGGCAGSDTPTSRGWSSW